LGMPPLPAAPWGILVTFARQAFCILFFVNANHRLALLSKESPQTKHHTLHREGLTHRKQLKNTNLGDSGTQEPPQSSWRCLLKVFQATPLKIKAPSRSHLVYCRRKVMVKKQEGQIEFVELGTRDEGSMDLSFRPEDLSQRSQGHRVFGLNSSLCSRCALAQRARDVPFLPQEPPSTAFLRFLTAPAARDTKKARPATRMMVAPEVRLYR